MEFYLHGTSSLLFSWVFVSDFLYMQKLKWCLLRFHQPTCFWRNSVQFLNLEFSLNLNICPVVCKNASQIKVMLVTLEERAVRGKDKRLGLWLRKVIRGDRNWMVASDGQVWVPFLSSCWRRRHCALLKLICKKFCSTTITPRNKKLSW